MLEVVIVFVSNFIGIALRTKQVLYVTEQERVKGALNGMVLSAVYLISTYLALRGFAELSWPVIAAYISSNGLAAYVVIKPKERQ